MFIIVVGLVVILALAGLVTLYVAYPYRGDDIPHAEWLSDAMTRSNQKMNQKLSELDDKVSQKVQERSRD